MIPIFVINLNRQPERLLSVERELAEVGLEFTRFPAIDLKSLKRSGDELVTAGVQACWESHIEVSKKIVSSNFTHALILEDDIEIRKKKLLINFLHEFDFREFDLVQIGYLTPGVVNKLSRNIRNLEFLFFKLLAFSAQESPLVKSRFGKRLRVDRASRCPVRFIPDDFLPGTHAYLISLDLAKKIALLNSPQFLSADDFFSALAKMRSFRMIRTRRSWINQKKMKGIGRDRFISQQ
jgi:GR25 family glycosyltransferase involved in LPS biosynthesis